MRPQSSGTCNPGLSFLSPLPLRYWLPQDADVPRSTGLRGQVALSDPHPQVLSFLAPSNPLTMLHAQEDTHRCSHMLVSHSGVSARVSTITLLGWDPQRVGLTASGAVPTCPPSPPFPHPSTSLASCTSRDSLWTPFSVLPPGCLPVSCLTSDGAPQSSSGQFAWWLRAQTGALLPQGLAVLPWTRQLPSLGQFLHLWREDKTHTYFVGSLRLAEHLDLREQAIVLPTILWPSAHSCAPSPKETASPHRTVPSAEKRRVVSKFHT